MSGKPANDNGDLDPYHGGGVPPPRAAVDSWASQCAAIDRRNVITANNAVNRF